jgi:hypothetical protein
MAKNMAAIARMFLRKFRIVVTLLKIVVNGKSNADYD